RNGMILFLGLLLTVAGATRAADPPPAGNWKVTILSERQQTPWLIQLANADGKWTGSVLWNAERCPTLTLERPSISHGSPRVPLRGEDQSFTIDANVPKEAAKVIKGSIEMDGEMVPCELTATTLTSLSPFDVRKDILANEADKPRVFGAGME